MELNLLMEFALLARYLNYGRAARELNLTQPTLSRHIVQLEEELGMQLFRRDRQSVSLTGAGRMFLPEAEAVVARYETARRRLREYQDGMSGELVLGYRWVYGEGPWPGLLQRFREAYPNISIRLVAFQDGTAPQDAVADGVLDVAVALCMGASLPSELQGVTLRPVPLLAVMGCPGGCINGGGQPRNHEDGYREKRMRALYDEDETKTLRKSHENPDLIRLYQDYLGEPCGHRSHHLLHTTYTPRGLYNELIK